MYTLDPDQLGSSFDSDDGPLLIETVGAGQMPDFDEEGRLIMGLEAQLQDLSYLYSDMTSAGGMCQDFAMEAFRLVPALEAKTPLGYYSKTVTKTRYVPAMEEITNAIWAAIAAATAVVSFAIYKFIRWIMGKSTAGENGSGGFDSKNPPDAKTIEADAKVAEAKVQDKEKFIENGIEVSESLSKHLAEVDAEVRADHPNLTSNGEPVTVQSFDAAVDWMIQQGQGQAAVGRGIFKLQNGLYAAILTDHPWVGEVVKVANQLSIIDSNLTQRLKIFSDIVNAGYTGSVEQMSRVTRDLEPLKVSLKIGGFAGMTTMGEVATHLSKLHAQAKALKIPDNRRMQITKSNEYLLTVMKSAGFKKCQDAEAKHVAKMVDYAVYTDSLRQVLAGKARSTLSGHPNGLPAEISHDVAAVARALQGQLLDYIRLSAEVSQLTNTVTALVEEMHAVIASLVHHFQQVMKKSGADLSALTDTAVYLQDTVKKQKKMPFSLDFLKRHKRNR